MTAIAPGTNRTATLVVVGALLIVVGAMVVGRVVPQKLLIATALTALLATDIAVATFRQLGLLALAVVVAGGAWSFGLWCSFRDFPLWPGLVPAAIVGAAVVFFAVVHRGDGVALAARLAPLNVVMLVAMLLSWSFFKRGVVGFLVGLIFVVWSALRLFVEVVQARADGDDDDRASRAAMILGYGGDLAWNALICWVRLAPDDDDDGFVDAALGW